MSTMNLAPYFLNNENPMNLYVASRIPYESVYQGSYHSKGNSGFEALVHHVSNQTKIPKEHIREKLLDHTRSKGMTDAEGAGVWSDIWSGVKHVASTLGNSALQGLSGILADPSKIAGAVSSVAPLLL